MSYAAWCMAAGCPSGDVSPLHFLVVAFDETYVSDMQIKQYLRMIKHCAASSICFR